MNACSDIVCVCIEISTTPEFLNKTTTKKERKKKKS